MRLCLLCLCFAIYSGSTFGQWYESQGVATIKHNDSKAAKNQAVQNALKKALLVAGASVSSVRHVAMYYIVSKLILVVSMQLMEY